MIVVAVHRSVIACLLVGIALTGCTAINRTDSGDSPETPGPDLAVSTPTAVCPVTQPEWVKAPEDSAVLNTPELGYYYVNQDRSIWASAWWTGGEYPLRVSEEGVKVGWFRPAGATLAITGRRVDGLASPLDAHVPCCYPTRFQATGLYFPTSGCWEVTARAAGSELSFVVWVEP